jgi:hypothetical protein
MLTVAALLSLPARLPAQDTIIFTKPADLPASKANAFMSDKSRNAGNYNAPKSAFTEIPRDYPLPKPMPRPDSPALKEELEKRKNWTLLTPEQILGIQTPEQILGIKSVAEQRKMSLEEQFLARQSKALEGNVPTNGHGGGLAPLAEYSRNNPLFDGRKDDAANPFRGGRQPDTTARNYDGSTEPPNAVDASSEKTRSLWAGGFFQPTAPKPTPEQVANMERFRELMNPPTPTPDKPDAPANFTTSHTPTPARPDPFIEAPPVVNPIGREAQPIESFFAKPAGIKPLPPIATPAPEKPKKKADWEAQTPPWMRDVPPPVSGKPF